MFFAIILCLLIVLATCKPKYNLQSLQSGEYISLERTAIIKGVLIILVVTWHLSLSLPSSLYPTERRICNVFYYGLGQGLIVAPFFFISGYGLFCSYTKRGGEYLKKLSLERIPLLLIHFDTLVILYYLCYSAAGKRPDTIQLMESLVAWQRIGNIEWYVFAILCFYTAFAFFFKRLSKKTATFMIFVFSLALICTLHFIGGKPRYWTDTLLSFWAGVYWGCNKAIIEHLLTKMERWRLLCGITLCVVSLAVYHIQGIGQTALTFVRNMASVGIVFAIMMISSCIHAERVNRFLAWCSKNLLALLVWHMLPIMMMAKFGMCSNIYLFIPCSLILVFLGAYGISIVWGKLDELYMRLTGLNRREAERIRKK